jgi:hypothetical protein
MDDQLRKQRLLDTRKKPSKSLFQLDSPIWLHRLLDTEPCSHSPTVVMLLAKIGQTYFIIVSLASFVNAAVTSVLSDSSSGPDLALGVSEGGKYTASLFGNP